MQLPISVLGDMAWLKKKKPLAEENEKVNKKVRRKHFSDFSTILDARLNKMKRRKVVTQIFNPK